MSGNHHIEVLLFDVNETLLDISILEPLFTRIFNDPAMMRAWFAELILYSQAMTLSGIYTPFGQLAGGTLRMVGANRHIPIKNEDIAELGALLGSLPPHRDVLPALARLQSAGYRLATLTNSPPAQSPTPLEKAKLDTFFEQGFSVDAVRKFKPHPVTYAHAAKELGVPLERICMVACHLWDTMGAQAAGCSAAFIARPNNNLLPIDNLPAPTFIAHDLMAFADQLLTAS